MRDDVLLPNVVKDQVVRSRCRGTCWVHGQRERFQVSDMSVCHMPKK